MVIGGSGNGEQIAANKVPGIRCALAWSEETARLAREHNDAQVVSVGGRMHPLEDMTRFVEVFLTTPFSGDERHARRIGQIGGVRAHPRAAAAAGVCPRYEQGRSRMPEGHTLHRLATALDDAFAGHPVRVSSPQGRFAESAALLDGRVLETAEACGKHLWVRLRARRPRARPPRALRQVRRAPRRASDARPRSARCGCGWSRRTPSTDRARRRRTPTCAAPPPASCSDPRAARALRGPARPRPAAPRRRPGPGLAPDPAQPGTDRRAAHGPVRRGRDRQRLPRRAALPAPRRPVPPGHQPAGAAAGARCGTTWWR